MHLEQPTPLQKLVNQLYLPPLHQLPEAFCLRCKEQLPLFVGDELAGKSVDTLYPETAVHLDVCPICLHEYEELVRLTTVAFYGEEIE